MSHKAGRSEEVQKHPHTTSERLVAARTHGPEVPADELATGPPSRRRLVWWLVLGLAAALLIVGVLAIREVREVFARGWEGLGGDARTQPAPAPPRPRDLRADDKDREGEARRERRPVDPKWEAFVRAQQENEDKLLEALLGNRIKPPADLLKPEEYRALAARTAEGKICLEFADWVNAGDAPPAGLLGPKPAVPTEPVAREEADRLDAEFILRQRYRVLEVRPHESPKDGPPRFLLVLKGSVASEHLQVRNPKGEIEPSQRALSNPDVIVEVRDGKIYGVRAQLHVW
jgi:hypothetical protein